MYFYKVQDMSLIVLNFFYILHTCVTKLTLVKVVSWFTSTGTGPVNVMTVATNTVWTTCVTAVVRTVCSIGAFW